MEEDYPRTLLELERRFSTDQACRDYLFDLRWPDGFRCPRCEAGKSWVQCADCGYLTGDNHKVRRYRDELFPTSRFRMTFDLLEEQLGKYQGSNEYLKILELAARNSEVRIHAALRVLLEAGEEQVSAEGIEAMLGTDNAVVVGDVQVTAVDLRVFDQLFTEKEVLQ